MARFQFFLTVFLFMALFLVAMGEKIAIGAGENIDGTWYTDARATFYGDMKGNETMYGACGYGNLTKEGYGLQTAALSTSLFNNGSTCGACYELQCVNDPQWCIPHVTTIITATNFCPPNYTKIHDIWCNPPQKHFDMAMPAFLKIVKHKEAGVVPVRYRRVLCTKTGGVKFEIKGNPYFIMVLILNVGGAGNVVAVKIKGSNTNWIQMVRNWGENWQIGGMPQLHGQALSFQVTVSDGKMLEFDNVAPVDWKFSKTPYDGKINF